MEAGDADYVDCVQGLAEIQRLTGTEKMHRTLYDVPALLCIQYVFERSLSFGPIQVYKCNSTP